MYQQQIIDRTHNSVVVTIQYTKPFKQRDYDKSSPRTKLSNYLV